MSTYPAYLNLRLRQAQRERLCALAERLGVTPSEALRLLLDTMFDLFWVFGPKRTNAPAT